MRRDFPEYFTYMTRFVGQVGGQFVGMQKESQLARRLAQFFNAWIIVIIVTATGRALEATHFCGRQTWQAHRRPGPKVGMSGDIEAWRKYRVYRGQEHGQWTQVLVLWWFQSPLSQDFVFEFQPRQTTTRGGSQGASLR
jgi:hypothetical protein